MKCKDTAFRVNKSLPRLLGSPLLPPPQREGQSRWSKKIEIYGVCNVNLHSYLLVLLRWHITDMVDSIKKFAEFFLFFRFYCTFIVRFSFNEGITV